MGITSLEMDYSDFVGKALQVLLRGETEVNESPVFPLPFFLCPHVMPVI